MDMVLIYQQLPLWFNGSCCCDVTKPAVLAYEHRLSLYANLCFGCILGTGKNIFEYSQNTF